MGRMGTDLVENDPKLQVGIIGGAQHSPLWVCHFLVWICVFRTGVQQHQHQGFVNPFEVGSLATFVWLLCSFLGFLCSSPPGVDCVTFPGFFNRIPFYRDIVR